MALKHIDYSGIGLLVGLECHQQLATQEKLFCSCNPQLFTVGPEITFLRRLRPTQSELGQVDPAAYFEFKKGVKMIYEARNDSSCLVEMDEEPPHELNKEALDIGLTVSLLLNARPVDEVHVMRKIVIDGSNTTGFQRTCVVALNGIMTVDGKEIPIQHVGLEEDAARKVSEKGSFVHYRIDRLGIPLIEVATGPVINSPIEAQMVALAIGQLLRATGKAKRGIGTIRQDLNISIRDGSITEIKGVQELHLVGKVVEYEVQRQVNLLKIRDELKKRGLDEKEIRDEFFDVTSVFKDTNCRVIKKAKDRNACVLSTKLPKFGGVLSLELAPGIRFGSELADIARFWGRVGGIFHTDELPAYGIVQDEIDDLLAFTKSGEKDCVVFVADDAQNGVDALEAVMKRAREALRGVPEETRAPNPDGTSKYSRPRPGAARMYPETDVPPAIMTKSRLNRLRSNLPEQPKDKKRRLMSHYSINEKLARQLLDSQYSDLFETVAEAVSISPTFIAATLTETLKSLKRDGVNIDRVTNDQIVDVFKLIISRQTTKEALPEIITYLAKHKQASVIDTIREVGLKMVSQNELEATVDDLISENKGLIIQEKDRAFGILMGMTMKRLRGRVDAQTVREILREKLKKHHIPQDELSDNRC